VSTLVDRIPQICKSVSLAEVLSERGHEPARTGGGTAYYHCPLPGHVDQHPSFSVKDGHWQCWSQCSTGGDVVDLVVKLDGCSKADAIDRLARQAGLGRPPKTRGTALSHGTATHLLQQFITSRCWSPQAAAEARLSVVTDGYGRPRVPFPYLYADEIVWYQDRAIGDALPKWLSPPGRRPEIYNANAMRLPEDYAGALWIVEGPSDVLAMLSTYEAPAVVGIPGAGNFSPEWVPAFAGLRQVVIVGDNDEAGQKFRSRVEALLQPVVERLVHLRVPEPYKDLDDWRRACGTDEPERFGHPLCAAIDAAFPSSEVAA
jgi:DNA primase